MIVLRSPKGWTGPKEVDGLKVEGFWRAHQVPIGDPAASRSISALLDQWMRSYQPETLFDERGALVAELQKLAPEGSAADGRQPARQWRRIEARTATAELSRFRGRGAEPGGAIDEATRTMGKFLREVLKHNADNRNFRIMGPDETASNRLDAVFEATDRVWMETIEPYDVHLSRDGRVMEVLERASCQGWLEGYLLTGRHGFFSCYEAFIHIVDSMFNQHAKWLKVSREPAVAPPDRLAELSAHLARLAAGPQRLQPPGSRLRRPRRQQEGRHRPRLSAAGCQHAAVGHRPLPAHL